MLFKKREKQTLPSDSFKKCLSCPNNENSYCVKYNSYCKEAAKYCKGPRK